jgi:hypothetical protein
MLDVLVEVLVEPESNRPGNSKLEEVQRPTAELLHVYDPTHLLRPSQPHLELVSDMGAGVGLRARRGSVEVSDQAEATMPSRRMGREWQRELAGTLMASWEKVWAPARDKDAADGTTKSGSLVASDSLFRRFFPDFPPVHEAHVHSAPMPVMPASPLGVRARDLKAGSPRLQDLSLTHSLSPLPAKTECTSSMLTGLTVEQSKHGA